MTDLEIKTTEDIFNNLCGDAYTDFIERKDETWISAESLKKFMTEYGDELLSENVDAVSYNGFHKLETKIRREIKRLSA